MRRNKTSISMLRTLGENISIARRRRYISSAILAERAGISRTTLHKIERGDSGVVIGSYFSVLFSLGLHEIICEIASPNVDHLGSLVGAHIPPCTSSTRSLGPELESERNGGARLVHSSGR